MYVIHVYIDLYLYDALIIGIYIPPIGIIFVHKYKSDLCVYIYVYSVCVLYV